MAAGISGDKFKPLQHIAGNLNPADLPTRTNCTAKDVEKDTPWQNGPSFLKLPRDQWPVSRDFKTKIPEDKIVKTICKPVIQVCHLKVSNKLPCSCRICSFLSVPCECAPCKSAIKPADSPHFQSLRHVMTQTNKLEKAIRIMARVLRASAAITKAKRPRGYQDFTRDETNKIMPKPLSAED